MPERQAAKLPDGGDLSVRSGDARRRRMAYAASIMTPSGIGAPTTTATGSAMPMTTGG